VTSSAGHREEPKLTLVEVYSGIIENEDAGKTSVDLGHYVSEIASAVMHTYAVDGIRLDLKVDHAPVSINVAMPVGLLVNELLTNAFKYAFGGRREHARKGHAGDDQLRA
jgi:two-component sensor histidine kinase